MGTKTLTSTRKNIGFLAWKRPILAQNILSWAHIGLVSSFGALLVGWLLVVARWLYLARHLFTLLIIWSVTRKVSIFFSTFSFIDPPKTQMSKITDYNKPKQPRAWLATYLHNSISENLKFSVAGWWLQLSFNSACNPCLFCMFTIYSRWLYNTANRYDIRARA